MKKQSIHLLFVFFFAPVILLSQTSHHQLRSVEDIVSAYPERAEFIFKNLNLDYPGLEKVRLAYQTGDIRLASTRLLDYYKNSRPVQPSGKRQLTDASQNTTVADSALHDIFTFQGMTGKVPRLANGRLKWDYTGPEDDIEWAWALNRHYPVSVLLDAYEATGDPKYVKYVDEFVKDWIISSWPYPGVRSSTAMWRGLEVSFRVKTWKEVFYRFLNSDLISPATQLLMLSALPEHAHYARQFHAQNNWLTMEISGLATVAAYWPEWMESPEWLEYTIGTMVNSMREQVYADGVQTELTSSYHHVALANFDLYQRICREAGVDLPDYFTDTIGQMWNYLALTIRPDGHGILNNDADLVNNRKRVLAAADDFRRDDWRYVATNGIEGTKPASGPSEFFPWAGHLISRSGYDEKACWSFFDIGPWGSGHQHNDKLNLALFACGRDLLVDAGRFAYRGAIADKFRKYATGSAGHNVLMIDGKGQAPGPKLAEKAIQSNVWKIGDDFDYATGSFNQFINLEGNCKHTRALVYVRGGYWIVVDRLETDRPRKITALWHWHPDNRVVAARKNAVKTLNKEGNLAIIPIGDTKWKISLIKGQETPDIQGWYSPVYNTFEPNVASVYSTDISLNTTFIWLLVPSEKKTPALKAEIVTLDNQEVKLKIQGPGTTERMITIPYYDRANASVNVTGK